MVRSWCLLGLAGAATDLREEQVDTEGSVLVVQVALELGDLLAQHVGSVTNTANDTETAGVGDGSGQLGASGDVHASKKHRVLDAEQVGDGSSDLLCKAKGELASESSATVTRERVRPPNEEDEGREGPVGQAWGDVRGEAILMDCDVEERGWRKGGKQRWTRSVQPARGIRGRAVDS